MDTTKTRPNPQNEAITGNKGGSGLLERTSFADGGSKRDIKHNLHKISQLPSKLRFSANCSFSDNLLALGIILRYTNRRKGFIY